VKIQNRSGSLDRQCKRTQYLAFTYEVTTGECLSAHTPSERQGQLCGRACRDLAVNVNSSDEPLSLLMSLKTFPLAFLAAFQVLVGAWPMYRDTDTVPGEQCRCQVPSFRARITRKTSNKTPLSFGHDHRNRSPCLLCLKSPMVPGRCLSPLHVKNTCFRP
jgi:hypothetical protein